MSKNNTVETAQKGQATTNIENNKKSNTPTGKVTTIKESEARKKAREEQYRAFRIGALRRRCKRLGYDDIAIEGFVKSLMEQMNAPKNYTILIMVNKPEKGLLTEALKNANLFDKINYQGDDFVHMSGNQNTLAKIREIAPPSAKIYPYAKKMESVIPKEEPPKVKKKPSNNTAEKKAAAKVAKLGNRYHGSKNWIHRRQKGRIVDAEGNPKPIRVHASDFFTKNKKKVHRHKPSPRPNRGTNPTKIRIGKRAWLKANSTQAILSLSERIAKQKAITVQMKAKNASKTPKNASTSTKKAA